MHRLLKLGSNLSQARKCKRIIGVNGIQIMINRHKKRKNSLEKWAELAVLRTYVENQSFLPRIKIQTKQRTV